MLSVISFEDCLVIMPEGIPGYDAHSSIVKYERLFVAKGKSKSVRGLNAKFDFGLETQKLLVSNQFNFETIMLFKCGYASKIVFDCFRQGHKEFFGKSIFLDLGPPLSFSNDLYFYETYKFNQKKIVENGFKMERWKGSPNSNTKDNFKHEAKNNLEFLIIDEFGLALVSNLLDSLDEDESFQSKNFQHIVVYALPNLKKQKLDLIKCKKNVTTQIMKPNGHHDSVFVIAGNWRESVMAYAHLMSNFSSKLILLDNCKSSINKNTINFKGAETATFSVKKFQKLINYHAKSPSKIKLKPSNFENGCYQYVTTNGKQNESKFKKSKYNIKIGVAILHYRRPELLLEALGSVFAQTRPPEQIKIFDDGSNEKGVSKVFREIETAHPNIEIMIQSNKYLGALRNFAAQNMTTDLIFFLDDDNMLSPHALETMEGVFVNTDADIIGSYSIPFNEGETVDFLAEKQIVFGGIAGFSTLTRNWICDGNCMIKRNFFLEIGGNSELYGIGNDDHEFFQKSFLNNAKIEIVAKPLYAARQMKKRLRDKHVSVSKNIKMMRVSNSLYFVKDLIKVDPLLLHFFGQQLDPFSPPVDAEAKKLLFFNIIKAIVTFCISLIPDRILHFFPRKIKQRLMPYLR
jgi:glycosyltransferase involved in cell wall biosynthesis